MTREIFVANWKQSGTREDAAAWVSGLDQARDLLTGEKLVIVCPPIKALDLVAQAIQEKDLPIAVGIQDIDYRIFNGEKNTGAQSPALLADSTTYVIIGHSETRRNNNLTDEDVAKKIQTARTGGLLPIVCVEEIDQARELKKLLGDYAGIIAYEPPAAIGTGNAANPQDANEVAAAIKEIFPTTTVLYGGSVDETNIEGFLQQSAIDGVLVGNKSLNASFFTGILRSA